MAKQCLFCPNEVNSGEHIWSDWIIRDLKFYGSVRMKIGKAAPYWLDDPEVKVWCVCAKCNNGWMSSLEADNKPVIHAMMHGEQCQLGKKDQAKLARWAVLKAMVVDKVNEDRTAFYSADEKEQVRLGAPLSIGTLAWLGRLSHKSFHVSGTDIWRSVAEVPKAIHAAVTTLIMGHLVIQVLTAHIIAQFGNGPRGLDYNEGEWDVKLLELWPATSFISWPPASSFTLRGDDSIAALLNRWKIGENVG